MDILPENPTLALSSYIEDYVVERDGDGYSIKVRPFYDDKWITCLVLRGKDSEEIAEYLGEDRTKEKILKIANELRERYGYGMLMPEAFSLALKEVVYNYIEICENVNL